MSDDVLAYEPGRLRTLAMRAGATIGYLDDTSCSDPWAIDAVATIRAISHRLSTTWLPLFVRIGASTSMTGWDTAGPGAVRSRGYGTVRADDYDELSDDEFVAVLATAAADSSPSSSGAPAMPPELLAELAARWDDLDPVQRQATILALLAFGWPAVDLGGQLSFVEASLPETYIDPAFAAAVVATAASSGDVPPALQPLVDRIAAEYGDELALALKSVDDDALFAALGVAVPFNLPRGTVAGFLSLVDPQFAAEIESRQLFDTTGFTLSESIVSQHPNGVGWAGEVGILANASDTGAYYEGGGFALLGGLAWPIVVNHVTTDEATYTADQSPPGEPSVSDLNGEDEGWTVVACASGVERIVEPAGLLETLAVAAAGSAVDLEVAPPNSTLDYIAIDPNGLPRFTTAPNTAGQPVNIPTIEDVNPANTAASVLNMGVNAGVVVTGLDNQRESAYVVVFEEHEDGRRRRARVTTYNVAEVDGEAVIVPSHLFVEDGRLMSQLVSYAPAGETAPATIAPSTQDVYDFCFSGHDMYPSLIVDDALLD